MARPARGRPYSSQGNSPRSSVTNSTATWNAVPTRPQETPAAVASSSHLLRALTYSRVRPHRDRMSRLIASKVMPHLRRAPPERGIS